MAPDRLARLLADLEAQGIDAARLRVAADLVNTGNHGFDEACTDASIVLRALADAAAEPERAERGDPKVCPRCISTAQSVVLPPCPFHDGGSR